MLNKIHRLLARSSHISRMAVKIRNQANSVIAYHLGETADSAKNGEWNIAKHVGPYVETFVDVGANIGDWTAQLLRSGAQRGFCFDPSSQCAERLRSRFSGHPVTVHQVAVSDSIGIAEFFEEPNCGETSSLATNSERSCDAVTVSMTTLDHEFSNTDVRIDFLKTDCEGWDFRVLRGAERMLETTTFVQFEYNSMWIDANSSLKEALHYLHARDFRVYLLKSTGLHPLRYEYWGDYFRYSNFFAVKASHAASVSELVGTPI